MSKRALLVGCNYPGSQAALRGCVNDVHSMNKLLVECYGFEQANIAIMIDTDQSSTQPTGVNIKNGLSKLVQESKAGDVLFFHFSGHGTQVTDKDGGEADNKDEAIVPTDMNLICDDDLRMILKPLDPEVKFTMVSDCCHSGSMLDHPEQQISGNKDPNAPPGVQGMDPMALMGMFFKDIPEGVVDDNKNRSLPQSLFCKLLGDNLGESVMPGQIHKMMHRAFGNDASARSLNYLGLISSALTAVAASQQGTRNASLINMIIKMLAGCMSAQAAQGGGAPGGEPTFNDTTGGGASAGGEATTAKGILITGCQSNETSADACPSGDASKAFGALTNALTTTVRAVKQSNPEAPVSYNRLVHDVREVLLKAKFTQNPCLECKAEDVEKPFIC